MTKKHIITIAGKLGSGKSSTSKMVASILSYEHASTGDFMRAMAEERGIKLDKLSKIAETDDSVDLTIDKYTKELGDKNNIVIDSRLGFYFISESFKVFLEAISTYGTKTIFQPERLETSFLYEDSPKLQPGKTNKAFDIG